MSSIMDTLILIVFCAVAIPVVIGTFGNKYAVPVSVGFGILIGLFYWI